MAKRSPLDEENVVMGGAPQRRKGEIVCLGVAQPTATSAKDLLADAEIKEKYCAV